MSRHPWQVQADATQDTGIPRAEVQRILDEVRESYARFGRGDDDIFRVLENRMIPLVPGEPVQFQEPGKRRWFNGTYDGPAGNPDDPHRNADVCVLSQSGRRVTVFLSSVQRRPC
jgi:hypothetical protein